MVENELLNTRLAEDLLEQGEIHRVNNTMYTTVTCT